MEIVTIEAQPRAERGTSAARRLRKSGRVPGIIYGHGETPERVAVSAHDFAVALEHGAHLLELRMGGASRRVLIKDVQYDHLNARPVHVDFMRVNLDERVTVSVPLELRGTPVGIHEGGILEQDMVDLEVSCLVTEIPEAIRVSVAEMKLGDLMHVRDVPLPPGVIAVSPGEAIVCSVRARKAAEAEVQAAEEPQAPEVIGRREKTEEDEEEDKKKS